MKGKHALTLVSYELSIVIVSITQKKTDYNNHTWLCLHIFISFGMFLLLAIQ